MGIEVYLEGLGSNIDESSMGSKLDFGHNRRTPVHSLL